MLCVIGLDAVVHDARAGVEVHTGIDMHEGGALRHIEDVRHAKLLQTHCILGYEPGRAGGDSGSETHSFNDFRKLLTSVTLKQSSYTSKSLEWLF